MRWVLFTGLLLGFGCEAPVLESAIEVHRSSETRPGRTINFGEVAVPDDGADLAIASWNLEHFPKHEFTVETVAALIEANDLDLIGVQEIEDPSAFEALAELLPAHEMILSFDSRTYSRVGILYRPDRLAVGDIDLIYRSDRSAFPRTPLVAHVSALDAHGAVLFDFLFVVVHLKAMTDEESRQRRVQAVALLDAYVREQLATESAIIIVGDYNDQLTDTETSNVFGPFLDDPELYRFLDFEIEAAGGHTYIPFRSMLDHILVTTDAEHEYGNGITEILDLDGTFLNYETVVSDHRPIVSRFALTPRNAEALAHP